ncbi:hypothetical protein [Marinobacter sp.]|uniref:hypothetical protein n=1 Tax=Marinobacter sp. TaxID=50741 RepID=UPI003A94B53B
MKNIFKIVAQGNPINLEMGPDALDIVLKITAYIDNNFMESDFFTLGNVVHEDFSSVRRYIQNAKNSTTNEDDTVSLSLDLEQYRLFNNIIWYGVNFGDDIPELESLHDDICDIREEMELIKEYHSNKKRNT